MFLFLYCFSTAVCASFEIAISRTSLVKIPSANRNPGSDFGESKEIAVVVTLITNSLFDSAVDADPTKSLVLFEIEKTIELIDSTWSLNPREILASTGSETSSKRCGIILCFRLQHPQL